MDSSRSEGGGLRDNSQRGDGAREKVDLGVVPRDKMSRGEDELWMI
jgi:hypothetical protein